MMTKNHNITRAKVSLNPIKIKIIHVQQQIFADFLYEEDDHVVNDEADSYDFFW